MHKIIPVAPFDAVVFGATGDLTMRKLLPALYYRFRDRQIPEESRIIAAARTHLSTGEYRDLAAAALERHVPAADRESDTGDALPRPPGLCRGGWGRGCGAGRIWRTCSPSIRTTSGPIISPPRRACTVRSAATSAPMALIGERSRVVLEKPIGHDLASARAINDQVGKVFPESQIFRIDHYLGKETVQNLLALRFANTIFERLWNADVIDHVQITVAETVGVEGRGGYYDTSAHCATCCRTTCLQLLCCSAWRARSRSTPMRCATRS